MCAAMKLSIRYLAAFILVLLAEILIALFVHDRIVRPYIGDVLVMVLMYTFIKIFLRREHRLLPVYLFVFAALVEVLQYFRLAELLGVENTVLSIIFGSTFDTRDILCYLAGSVLLLLWENRRIYLRKHQAD